MGSLARPVFLGEPSSRTMTTGRKLSDEPTKPVRCSDRVFFSFLPCVPEAVWSWREPAAFVNLNFASCKSAKHRFGRRSSSLLPHPPTKKRQA